MAIWVDPRRLPCHRCPWPGAGPCVRRATERHRHLDKRLTNDEAEKIARLIVRLPELVELERDRNKARSRRKAQPFRFKPVTVGDLIREGKLLEGPCGNCRPARHLYIDAGSLDLPKRLPLPEVANHLVCGAKNSDTYHPIWARPDARVPGVTGQYPDFNKR